MSGTATIAPRPNTQIAGAIARTISRIFVGQIFSSSTGASAGSAPIMSFDFGKNQHLAFSIEARYKAGQTYSAILGFFRQYELIFNAADERDVRWRIADLALQQCSGQGPAGKVEASGFNDPAIAFHKNILGLPAFRHNEIADAIPQTFLSRRLTFNPPLGQYDRNSPVNKGANRWAFTPLVNLNIPLNSVAWVEVYAWGRFFTNNNAFQGSNLLSQNPLGSAGLYYSHNIGKKAWAAIGAYYDNGGETYINHIFAVRLCICFRPSVAISSQV